MILKKIVFCDLGKMSKCRSFVILRKCQFQVKVKIGDEKHICHWSMRYVEYEVVDINGMMLKTYGLCDLGKRSRSFQLNNPIIIEVQL